MDDAMLLHTTTIVVQEHVIHLLLVVNLQVFFLRGKPCSEIL